MPDLITRLKLQNQEFNSNLNSSKKAVKDFQDQSDDASKSLKDMGDKGTNAAKDLLKEMGKIEQGGRSVSNYKQQLAQLQKQIVDLTVNYRSMTAEMQASAQGQAIRQLLDEATERASVLKDAIGDVQQEIKNMSSDTAIWDGMKQGIQGMSGALQAFVSTGVMGEKSTEKLVGVISKLQAIEKTTNGVIAIGNMLQKNSAAVTAIRNIQLKLQTKATAEATLAQKALNLAMNANPIGILITVLGLAAGALLLFTKNNKDTEKQADITAESIKKEGESFDSFKQKVGSSVRDTVGQFKLLANEYKNCKTELEKTQFIEDNKQAFDNLGLAVTDVNSANKIFIDQAPQIIEAMLAIARVDALKDLYKDAVKEQAEYIIQTERNVEKAKQISAGRYAVDARGKSKIDEDLKAAGIDKKDVKYTWAGGQNSAGWYDLTPEQAAKINEHYKEAAREAGDAAISETESTMSSIETLINGAVEDAEKAKDVVKGLFTDPNTNVSGKSGGGSSSAAKEEERALVSQLAIEKQKLELLNKERPYIDENTDAYREWNEEVVKVKTRIEELEQAEKELQEAIARGPRQPMESLELPDVSKLKLPTGIDSPELKLKPVLDIDKPQALLDAAEKAAEMVNTRFKLGLMDQDTAKQMIDNINKVLEAENIKVKVNFDFEDAANEFSSGLRDITDRANGWIGAADGIVGSFGRIYDSVTSLEERLEDTNDPIKRFFMVFETGISVLSSITSVIEAVATVTELLNASKQKSIGTLIGETAAIKENTKASIENAGADAAGAVAKGAKSAADIPVIGWIMAGVAALTLLGTLLSAMSSAKKFAAGGIVGGNNYNDGILAQVSTGEMILNKDQQSKLFRMINEGNTKKGQGGQVEFKINGTQLVGVLNNINKRNSKL